MATTVLEQSHNAFEEKYAYTIKDLDHMRKEFKTRRSAKERMWKVLDAYESGKFWESLRKKLPKHQIIPDTNMVFYVKDNLVSSVYSAPFIADVFPIDPGDQKFTRQINKFIEYEYNRNELGYTQLRMGSKTALLNVSFLQLGWDSSAKFQLGDHTMKGQIDYTYRDPMAVLLDPNYDDFQKGRALFIALEESFETLLANYPDKKELLKAVYVEKSQMSGNKVEVVSNVSRDEIGKDYLGLEVLPTASGMVSVFVAFKRVAKENGGFRIDQVVYTSDLVILSEEKGISPNYFPVVALYGLPPDKNGYGIGVCQRILKNALSVNILDSIAVTHTYAAQRTPVIVDTSSGISARRLQKDLNNPDRIFQISNGDVTKVLHRLEYPQLPPNLEYIKRGLMESIYSVSGVDEKYTGKDTASVTTTGGMERLQQRASLTDNTRIAMIEKYARDLTKMILDFYSLFGGKRVYATKTEIPKNPEEQNEVKAAVKVLELDFNKLKSEVENIPRQYGFHINASPQLPKNRARLAEAANIIMQVQMQYQQAGQQVELMTPEEWLYFQDLPQKDMMLDRMEIQRLKNDYEEITSTLANFDVMTKQGMRPEAAVDQLVSERKAQREPGVMKAQLNNK